MQRYHIRVGAPVAAQALAFGAVLVIGAFIGHPPGTRGHPDRLAGHRVALTIEALSVPVNSDPAQHAPSGSFPFPGSQVAVLASASLRLAAAGQLSATGRYSARLTEGTYQVCVQIPAGWELAQPGGPALPGWGCSEVFVGASPVTVRFSMAAGPATHEPARSAATPPTPARSVRSTPGRSRPPRSKPARSKPAGSGQAKSRPAHSATAHAATARSAAGTAAAGASATGLR